MVTVEKPIKPLGHRAYGSIPHLPGSRRGPADKGLSEQQAALLTEKTRDRHDIIYVQEKLDGSNVSVANIGGVIVPLIRAGYEAKGSNYKQHHHFHDWVMERQSLFLRLLQHEERCVGEWLMEAHGTRYNLVHEPFVVFDIMVSDKRCGVSEVMERCARHGITTPRLIHRGRAISIEEILPQLEPSGHGAIDPVEGAVWRIERNGITDFLGKYVRPEKVDGKYLENISGNPPIYNWTP
jgi:hypothetical protein